MNKVFIMGFLGQDPDLRQTSSGKEVCNFSVATTYKSKDREETEWHKVIVWGNVASNCAKYLYKGSKVLVEGRLKTSSFVDKEGITRHSTDLIATTVSFLDSKPKKENTQFNLEGNNSEYFDQTEEVPF